MILDRLVSDLAWLAVASHRNGHAICAASVIFSAGLSANLFWVRRRFLADEPWIRYFGWAFAAIAGGHALGYLKLQDSTPSWLAFTTSPYFKASISGVSSVLLLIGSLDLLRQPWPRKRILSLPVLVPLLAAVFAPPENASSAVALTSWPHLVTGVLDGSVSAGVLITFGLALHRNLALASYARWLRMLVWGPSLVYAVVLLLYPFVEWGTAHSWPWLSGPLNVALSKAGPELSGAIPVDVWWSLVLATTLLCKVGAGVPLWKLVMDRLPFVAAPRRLFSEEDGGLEALVRVAVRQFRASAAEIFLAIPGGETPRVLRVWWDPEAQRVRREILLQSAPQLSIVRRCLADGDRTHASPHGQEDPRYQGLWQPRIAGMMSFIVVPVISDDETVGALELSWNRTSAFGPSTVAMAAILARQLAPALRAHRGFEALAEFNRRVVELRARRSGWKLNEAVAASVIILNDILESARVRVIIACGFKRRPVFGEERADVHDWSTIQDDRKAGLHVFEIEAATLRLGRLIVVTRRGRPLPFDSVVFQILARSVADVALDAARESAADILARHQGASQSVQTPEELSQLVGQICQDADLIWLGFDALPEQLCPNKARTYVHHDAEEHLDLSLSAGRFKLIPAERPDGSVRLCVRLGASKSVAWFGVPLATFGQELEIPSPWSEFIERLGVVIDAALVRIRDAVEVSTTVFEATQRQAVQSLAIASGTVVHQITNLTRDLSAGTRDLQESIYCGETATTQPIKESLAALSRSAHKLGALTGAIMESVRFRAERPCPVRGSLEQLTRLFHVAMSASEIELSFDCRGDGSADVPTYVFELAIGNLITNARDAIKRGGCIQVFATQEGEFWSVRVTDDGPGIPEDLQERLFRLGNSTRHSGASGWGLYLTRQSLREHRGDIWLERSAPGATTFCLRVPAHTTTPTTGSCLEEK